jgi:CRP-like cAMP-binding protein
MSIALKHVPAGENRILSLLPVKEFDRLAPHMLVEEIGQGRVLHESSEPIAFVYFPGTAVVSILALLEDGSTTEIGLVGPEGVVGFSPCLGVDSSPNRAVVHVAGTVLKVPVTAIKEEFALASRLQRSLLCYAHALYIQSSQAVACARYHPIPSRLARWLLTIHDRVRTDDLDVTQESIANMLGTSRPRVSIAIRALKDRGLIGQGRRRIKVLDRPGLEAVACECYRIIRNELERVLMA